MGTIDVSREPFIEAEEGTAPHASVTYARAQGSEMFASVRDAAMHVKPKGDRHYYARRLYTRRSLYDGRTWVEEDELERCGPKQLEATQTMHMGLLLDPYHDLLIDLYMTHEVDLGEGMFAIGNTQQRTQRSWYRLSRDGGRSWSEAQQIIDAGDGYDADHWAPGVTFGTQGARPSGQSLFLADGTLVVGFTVMHPEKPADHPRGGSYYITTRYAQARLTHAGDRLDWRFGDEITVAFPLSTMGCAEPALTRLEGDRLYNTMRCQGSPEHGTYAVRYSTLSEDGGMTWTAPEPLVYDDGETVWTPASVHRFFLSSKTGKTYLLANILEAPVYHQKPRYPLCLAEFDIRGVCVLRDTVEVIQDLPPGAPAERRYTNFSMHEERGNLDLILVMPEQPRDVNFTEMARPEEFTADCFAWRVRLT